MSNTDKTTHRIDCEIIQDLMPSYIDGIASRGTLEAVEEHVKECAECRSILESMRSGEEMTGKPDGTDRKEIDYLRKNRKKNKRAVALGIILTLLIAAAAAGAKVFLIGSEYKGDLACDISAEGTDMTVGLTAADSIHVIRGVDFTMNDGVARGTVRAVVPGIHHSSGTFSETAADDTDMSFNVVTCDWAGSFSFDEDIREVWIGDRIYWADGRDISAKAAQVYGAGHEFVGDAPANGALLTALGITDDLGSLYSELETDREPYIWTVILDEDQTKYNPDYLEEHLKGYGYVLLGTVSNLSEVDFRYTSEGKTVVKKVTADDASKFFGKDIKVCRADPAALSELMEKAGIR